MSKKTKVEKLDARKERIELLQAAYDYNAQAARDPLRTGRFRLYGDVSEERVIPLVEDLHAFHVIGEEPAPIVLDIFSRGGESSSGWMLYDTLRALSEQGANITTRVRGVAASMAGVVFLAGDVRIVGRQSSVMIHQPSSWLAGNLSQLREDLAWVESINQSIKDLYLERTKIRARRYDTETANGKAWWLGAGDCLALEVAHEVG